MSAAKKTPLTRTISARLPNTHADRIEAEAAAKHVTNSALISQALFGRDRPAYPALAALGRLIAISKAVARDTSCDPATLAELRKLVAELRDAAWADVTP